MPSTMRGEDLSARPGEAAQHVPATARRARSEARDAVTSPWFTPLARAGYAAKGIIYLIMGILALATVLGDGAAPTDPKGTFQTIVDRPFGHVLLLAVSVGLVGYAVWCLCESLLDVDGRGTSAKGIVARAGYGVVGAIYLALAAGAYKLATGGSAGKNTDTATRDFTALLLAKPLGVAFVVAAGVGALAIAGVLYYRTWTADFEGLIRPRELGQRGKSLLVALGRIGYAALGIVYTEISIFLVVAALHHDAGEAQGLGGALRQMERQPFGSLLLTVVALGLLAYGMYSVASARYRRVGRS